MLFAVTGLMGCPVDAEDGAVGSVKDFLFDDETWTIRWMVVDTGVWLPGRKVLIHPSAIVPLDVAAPGGEKLPMMGGPEAPVVLVRLTKDKIEGGPTTREEDPVTRAMQVRLYEYYGWDPAWGKSYFRAGALAGPAAAQPAPLESAGGDPHLFSAAAVKGYHVHATDGDLGHVENFLADDENWDIRYLVVATRNWLPGKHVQLAPFAVEAIDPAERRVDVDVTREAIRSSPEWDPLALANEAAQESYHRHFGWPGYGW